MKWVLRLVFSAYIVMLGSEEYFKGPGPTYKIAVALLSVFLFCILLGKIKVRFSQAGAFLLLFGMFAVTSLFWTMDPERTLKYDIILWEQLTTTWITVCCLEDERDCTYMAWMLVLLSVFPGVCMIHDHLTGRAAWSLGFLHSSMKNIGDRMTFGDCDPNLLAFRYVVSAVASVWLVFKYRTHPVRWALLGLVGMCVFGILLTGSRGGMISLAISTVILILGNARNNLMRSLFLMAGVATLIVVSIPFLPSTISKRFLGTQEELASGSMAGRRELLHESLDSIGRNPTLGVGYMAFEAASRKHGGAGQPSHNDPLQVLVDLGAMGFALYLAMMATLFWQAAKAPSPWHLLGVVLLMAYVASSASITLLGAKLPWVLFGVVLSLGRARVGASDPDPHDLGRKVNPHA